MLTHKLKNLLIKHNLVIDKKISKEIFEQRQNAIITLFQKAGYENVDRNLVLFLCYFNGKKISHKGHIIEFNLAHMMTYRLRPLRLPPGAGPLAGRPPRAPGAGACSAPGARRTAARSGLPGTWRIEGREAEVGCAQVASLAFSNCK